jgi:hypothetical protein
MAQMDRMVAAGWRAHRKGYARLVTGPMIGRHTSSRRFVEYVILRNGDEGTYPTPLVVHARWITRRPRPLGRAVRGKLARRGGRRR